MVNILVVGSGDIGKAVTDTLHHQYPLDNVTNENRESPRSVGASISFDQTKSFALKLRRAGLPANAKRVDFSQDNLGKSIKKAHVVIVTVGVARTSKDQPRTALGSINTPVLDPIAETAGMMEKEHPNRKTTYIIATNPVDLMVQRFQEISGIPHDQIIGLGGELDAERLRQSMRLHLNLDYDQIRGERALADHGPNTVIPYSQIEVFKNKKWQKLTDLPQFKANEAHYLKLFNDATISGGGKFSGWTGKSDGNGPAGAIAYMVEQIYDARFGDKSASLPITGSTYIEKEGIYNGTTVVFNRNGTHSPAKTPELSNDEKKLLDQSYAQARDNKKEFDNLITLMRSTGQAREGYTHD